MKIDTIVKWEKRRIIGLRILIWLNIIVAASSGLSGMPERGVFHLCMASLLLLDLWISTRKRPPK